MPICPTCGSDDITKIAIGLESESDLDFYSCRICEEKWWQRDGDRMDLADVIDLTGSSSHSRAAALR